MTRIIAGSLGSLRLKTAAKATRPTSDRVKESIFSKLENLGAIEGATVLDLFAGTGALGLEAISRGAKKLVLVENNPAAFEVCSENLKICLNGLAKQEIKVQASAAKQNAEKYLNQTEELFDLVFIDPPYEMPADDLGEVLNGLAQRLNPEAIVVLERSSKSSEVFENYLELTSANYGDTRVAFLKAD